MRRISGRLTVGAALLALVLACNPDTPVRPGSPAFDEFAESAESADVVTEWNRNTLNAIKVENTNPVITGRRLAIVQAAVFDAVNGIERRYIPYHVGADAPRGASRRAAAIQAAYVALVNLFPSQKATFDLERSASLASITDGGELEESESIARGIEWGEEVANDILAWRSTDGLNPPFNAPCPIPLPSSPAPGQWRPTPPDFRAAVFPQMACVTPFAMASPSQFRPAGPPDLASDQYTRDFNEVKEIGSATSSTRTAEQTQIALFWDDNGVVHWNRIALSMAAERHTTLSENARLFALLNIAMADATIAAWDAKFHYNFWRPVTAIRLADTDGNPATTADAEWFPLRLVGGMHNTPAHQDYPSGHSTSSGAAAAVLASSFGDNATFTAASDNLPGVLRTYTSFSGASEEVNDARVYIGIHFRSACIDGRATGDAIGNYVVANVAQPNHGRRS